MKKLTVLFMVTILITASMFTACKKDENATESGVSGNVKSDSKDNVSSKDGNSSDEENGVLAFEDLSFPDLLPQKPPMAENDWYGYDNIDKKYSIEILTHNYGKPPLAPDEDPVNMWLSKQFNMDIKLTAINGGDIETTLSTRFASGDEPDVMMLPSRELAFTLSDQNLLVDAKKIYPYMPQTVKFATKNMIVWSTNKSNQQIPFITKYGIQDGVWGFAIRQDWLDKFDMEYPTTKEQLLDYAKACTFEDPDGNGKDDTYFMTGAGGGTGFGMLGGYNTMFGNPAPVVKNGELSHPMFNGTEKEYLSFLKELYDEKVLAPDWYSIEWEKAKSYTMNDKVGMVWYPAGVLFQEYTNAKNQDLQSLDVWSYYKEAPIENGKFGASGNPGYMWGFSAKKFEDIDKLKRVAHMLDTMVIGGKNFFHTVQGSTNEVYEAADIECEDTRECVYLDDGTFYLKNDATAFPWDMGGKYCMTTAIWQQFGLSVIWQLSAPSDDPFEGPYGEKTNKYAKVINSYDRWPNDGLKITLTGEAAEASSGLIDYVNAQQYKFVTGVRSFDEWDKYCEEWLNKGGKKIIQQTAECLNVPVPDYAK